MPGMYITFKYAAKFILPLTYANTPIPAPIMALTPAAKPSKPSVKLAPFDTVTNADGSIYSKSGENYITIQYERIIPLLVEAIKEQQAQIEELKAHIKAKA